MRTQKRPWWIIKHSKKKKFKTTVVVFSAACLRQQLMYICVSFGARTVWLPGRGSRHTVRAAHSKKRKGNTLIAAACPSVARMTLRLPLHALRPRLSGGGVHYVIATRPTFLGDDDTTRYRTGWFFFPTTQKKNTRFRGQLLYFRI